MAWTEHKDEFKNPYWQLPSGTRLGLMFLFEPDGKGTVVWSSTILVTEPGPVKAWSYIFLAEAKCDVAEADENLRANVNIAFDAFKQEDSRKFFVVEYDKKYFGGDYSDVGNFVYIPLAALDSICLDEQAKVNWAFRAKLNLDPQHIIHYNLDELYTRTGDDSYELFEEC